jgi:transposase
MWAHLVNCQVGVARQVRLSAVPEAASPASPSECRRSLPRTVAGPDDWTARGLHPVRGRHEPDPRSAARDRAASRHPDSDSADRAYSNRRTRRYPRGRGIRHAIPEKTDQARNRRKRGKAGGRPPGLDKERYKKRNVVERAINKLKNFRAAATRYDWAYVYLGTVRSAALVIWLRS